MIATSPSEKIARRIVEGCALAATLAALLAVFVRVGGQWWLWVAHVRPHFNIALHTAWLLTWLSIALFVHNRWPRKRGSQIFSGVVVGLIIAAGLAAIIRQLFHLRIEFEAWFVGLATPTAKASVGRLSPHTALTFLCAAGALGCLLNAPETARWRRRVAFALAALAFGSGAIATLGFAVGTPLLYGYKSPSMMWLTAVIFVLLSVGLMLAAFPNNWLLQGSAGETGEIVDAPTRHFRLALVIMVVFLTGGIGTAGFFFLRKEQANLRSRVEQELVTVADLKVAQIADWRSDRLKQANLLFRTPYAARRALDVLAEPSSQLTRGMFTSWLDPFLETGPYAAALVLDPQLNLALIYPTNGTARLFEAERGPAEDALRTRQLTVADLFRPAEKSNAVYLSLMVPIVVRKEGDRDNVPAAGLRPSAKDHSAALLVLRMDASRTLFPLVKKWPTSSRTAETLLVRREGDDCLFLTELRYQTDAELRFRSSLARTDSPAVQAALGKERVVKGLDYRDVPVLAVTRKIPNSPWALVAKMDEEEIYAPMRERGRALSIFLGVLIVAVTLGLNLLWRQRDVEFLRRQMASEHERFALAQRLAHVMTLANDIIIMTDDQWRILEANDRARENYGYTLAELRQMRGPDLRAPAARADFVAFDKEFRSNGQVVAETVHQRKDGSTFPVEISTRRVEIHGAIHSLAIIRDITERKRAEDAMRQSEEKYRVLFDAAVEGVAVANLETKVIQYANPAYCAMYGYTHEELLRLRVDELHPQESLPRVMAEFEAQSRGERNVAVSIPCLRNDGTVFQAEISAKPAVIAGRPVLVGFFTDITERKQAEAQLRKLSHAVEQSPASVVITDATGKIEYVNPKFSQVTGYSLEEARGKNPRILKSGQHPAEFYRQLWQTITTGGEWHGEFHNRKKNGELYWEAAAISPILDSNGMITHFLAVKEDITGRKRAEARISEQAALLDAATDAIYVRALDHTITYWNDGAARLYGWSRPEALGRKISELGDKNFDAFDAAHATLLKQGNWSGELKTTSKAGKEFVVFCRWTLLRDEQGRPKEVLAINSDITEKRQLENRYLRAQRLEGIGALAGGIAHDLNNIFGPILMSTSLLRETTTDPESRSMLATMAACAQRGADIIKQLLTFARGKPSARVPMPVRHLLQDMEKIIRETFPRNIQPRVSAPPDLWPVLGDPTQIHQALMNLCVNARDAMPDGGTLTVAATNLTLDEAAAAATPDAKPGPYVCVSVTDTGTGIQPEHLDRIFDPFFTTKEIGKGTGLGLPTVLGIVRGHEGFVRVNSRVGHGTTLEIYLRASPEARVASSSDTEIRPPRGQGELILVVDDEASVRTVVQRTLEMHGYRVVIAAEGNEALTLFAEHGDEVKAVITDMMMPGMEGPALIRALRNLKPQLPIVGMTGLAQRAGVKGMEKLDLPMLLTKPFGGAKLLATMHEALANHPDTPAEPADGRDGI